MKNINDLVTDGLGNKLDFESVKRDYNSLVFKSLTFEDCKRQDENSGKNTTFNFKETIELYNVIETIFKEKVDSKGNCVYNGIDIKALKEKLEDTYAIYGYKNNLELLKFFNEEKNDILRNKVQFYFFGDEEKYTERCHRNHFLIRDGDELFCANCGATTKDYSIAAKDDVDFLALAAEAQGLLLKDVSKEDVPLLKVLIEENDRFRKKLSQEEIDKLIDEERFDLLEEFTYEDDSEIVDITREIRKAHKLDSKKLEGLPYVNNPKYFSDDKKEQLLEEINNQILMIERSSSKFKDLLLEQCKVARYEVLILSGEHIPSLYKQIDEENDQIAFIKAYCNLCNINFRINSGYFDDDDNLNRKAGTYYCRTADPIINQKVLDMKLKK